MTGATPDQNLRPGPVAWMVRNRVTPNLLMVALLLGGFIMALRIKQEVFPEFDLDRVTVVVPYPGSSPEEVEQGIILAVEEAIRGLDGIKEVTARASEGQGRVVAELYENVDRQKVYQDIKQEVDRITTFPRDAEEPEVTLSVRRREVLDLIVYGDVGEWSLREATEFIRDRLLSTPDISQVEIEGAREYEIHIEIPQTSLRAHALSLDRVADTIAAKAVEIPGGKIETAGGEILLRFTERRDWARQFAELPLLTRPGGGILRVRDLGTVREGFADTDVAGVFAGQPAMTLEVYRVGDQTPLGVSASTREAMAAIERDLPPGVEWAITRDRSDIYRQRLELLLRNAFIGLCLVLLLLGLFLEFKVAFWVTLGIPISFLGAFLFVPAMGVTINMISMFAFIIALGIVVDDAIVAGENIYELRQRGVPPVTAAIQGARQVMMPITFAILTNIVAFTPLLFVPGFVGKIWRTIPLVVCTTFLISLVEAVFILPAHLAHTQSGTSRGALGFLHRWQQGFSRKVRLFVRTVYGPVLERLLAWRWTVAATGLALLLLTAGYVESRRIGRILMPRVEADYAYVTATLPYGSPMTRVEAVRDRLLAAGRAVVAENGGSRLSRGTLALIRENEISIRLYLTPPEARPLSTTAVSRLWRRRVGALSGLEALKFQSDRGGPGGGAALTVELTHRHIDILDRAGSELAARLGEFAVVKDIDDGYTPGKQQLNFRIKPAGESLGLTAAYLAREVRNAFQGNRAIRQQRGRHEVTVRVRRPLAERINEYDLERMIVRTPAGGEAPLLEVAAVERSRAYTVINRRDGRRAVTVTADVDPIQETDRVLADLQAQILPGLVARYPGLNFTFEGRQARLRESFDALTTGLILALLAIYFLLAIPFSSYWQPLVVMLAIPFGTIGAVLGHILMGYSLSIMSMMGMVALAGVVVNDSLILVDYANRLRRDEGLGAFAAIWEAGLRRFRPIVLTTLTTFGGLAPMIFETSRQARFMIPMALSLGFGILFATVITLVLLPCFYLLAEDVLQWFGKGRGVSR